MQFWCVLRVSFMILFWKPQDYRTVARKTLQTLIYSCSDSPIVNILSHWFYHIPSLPLYLFILIQVYVKVTCRTLKKKVCSDWTKHMYFGEKRNTFSGYFDTYIKLRITDGPCFRLIQLNDFLTSQWYRSNTHSVETLFWILFLPWANNIWLDAVLWC